MEFEFTAQRKTNIPFSVNLNEQSFDERAKSSPKDAASILMYHLQKQPKLNNLPLLSLLGIQFCPMWRMF